MGAWAFALRIPARFSLKQTMHISASGDMGLPHKGQAWPRDILGILSANPADPDVDDVEQG